MYAQEQNPPARHTHHRAGLHPGPPGPTCIFLFVHTIGLVDDGEDSCWTFTMAAYLLRRMGSGKVWPQALVLAKR